jgi:hypothetical protein
MSSRMTTRVVPSSQCSFTTPLVRYHNYFSEKFIFLSAYVLHVQFIILLMYYICGCSSCQELDRLPLFFSLVECRVTFDKRINGCTLFVSTGMVLHKSYTNIHINHYSNAAKCALTFHLISHFTPTCFGVHDAILREYTKFKSICWGTRLTTDGVVNAETCWSKV